ncbi:MAG: hypothetical protein QXZ28_05355 [Candidatus Methanomethylicaceae archaeon]
MVALRHFLLTIPLGSLLVTLFFYFLIPHLNLELGWHEAFLIITGINIAVTILAYVLIPSEIKLRRWK